MKKSDHEDDEATKEHCMQEETSSEPSDRPNNKTDGIELGAEKGAEDINLTADCTSPATNFSNGILPIKDQQSSNEGGVSDTKVLQEPKEKGEELGEEPPTEAGRRSSRLRGKRPKLTQIITSSDEEFCESSDDDGDDYHNDLSDECDKLPSKCARPPKKKKAVQHTSKKPKNNSNQAALPKEMKPKKTTEQPVKPPKEYSTGSFVVLKTDFHASTTPPLWRIDGKALLQKYIHVDRDGQIAYKNTSTYSGWTLNNRDQYYPATVEYISQTRKDIFVKFKRELIVDEDSD